MLKSIKKFWGDYKRLGLLLITFIILGLYLGMFSSVVPVTLVIPLFAVILAHIVRKTLHGYINTEKLLKKVEEENSIAAAIVVVAVLSFTAVLTAVFTALLL